MSSWRVEGHVFIGAVWVDVPMEEPTGVGRALVKRIVDGEMPFVLDLCTVGSMRQRTLEHPGWTSLYSMSDGFIGSVNAPLQDLLPHFLASRTPNLINVVQDPT